MPSRGCAKMVIRARRTKAVSDLKTDMEQREKQVAHNEAARQATSAIRLSSWALIAALLACAVAAMFVLMVVRL